MATQVSCGYPWWLDGMQWNGLVSRRYNSGPAVLDAGSAAALTPAGGVFPANSANLKITAPVSGLTVNVAPGYVMVPSTTAQNGGYRFGLMSSGSLTVASNASGSTRKDLVLATVTDLGSSSSTAVIQYVTGTTSLPSIPASSIVLAEVDVTNGASSITSGMITDKRSFVVAPGGVLPIASAAVAPAAQASQLMWNMATSLLNQGGQMAGQTLPFTPGSTGVSSAPVNVATTFSTAGSHTWTCPAGVASAYVECWGGGGGGISSGAGDGCSGGGGGEYAAEPMLIVTPGTTYTVVVGAAGTAGTNTNGGSGGNSTFASTSVVAHGGPGSAALNTSVSGGTGSGNTVHYDGGQGGKGQFAAGTGGGGGAGGGAGGTGGAGGAGAGSPDGSGGHGGSGTTGGGAGGNGGESPSAAGQAGSAPGGAGGGGYSNSAAGGAGAAGQVKITTQGVVSNLAFSYAPSGSSAANGTTVQSVSLVTDGMTDYEIRYYISKVTAGSGSVRARVILLIDGTQVDETDTNASTSAYTPSVNGAFYTSAANGTRMSAGTHVVSVKITAATGTASASSPWQLFAGPVPA
jgi:hypothetical protein